MKLQNFVCFCFMIGSTLMIHQIRAKLIEPTEEIGVELGEVEDYWNDIRYSIKFMQEDKLIPGNILMYADEEGLISISPEKVISVVAEKTELQFKGVKTVSSFAQHNSTTLILVDGDSNCLLWLNRIDAFSEDPDFSRDGLAGNCRNSNNFESVDGTFDEARFNLPGYIIMGRSNDEYFISESENGDGVIKHLNLTQRIVTTLLGGVVGKPEWRNPHAMLFIPERKMMYISTRDNMYSVSFGQDQQSVKSLTSGNRNVADGKLSDSEFMDSQSLTSLKGNLLLALPESGNRMRVIDLDKEYVYSTEFPSDKRLQCLLAVPSQKRIYFGGSNGLSVMHYKELKNGATSFGGALTSTLAVLLAHMMI